VIPACAWRSLPHRESLRLDATLAIKFFHSHEATNKIPSDIYVLISKNEEKMLLMYNDYWTFSIVLNGYNNLLKEHFEYLKEFIMFLKRNYDIE